jgi:hypothetical protein
MFEAPLTFAEALAELNSRLDTPTALKYRQIVAAWDADMRARAFFSARVTEAGVLSELHSKVQAVLDGKMTDKQAVALLRDYFVGSGADPLARMGFAPPHRGPERIGARSIDELASLPRLELIIETNLRMAQECGHYQSWAESASYWRYGIWRCGWAKEHREEHLAREGRVYAFDHPIWTQSPPGGEFNCHCYREIASEEDIRRLGLSPEPLHSPFTPSSLGFDPSRSLRQPPPFGKRVRPEYADGAQRKIDAFAREEDPTPTVPPVPAPTPTEQHAAKRQAQWQQAYEKRVAAFEQKIIDDAEKNLAAVGELFLPSEQRDYTKAERDDAEKRAKEKIKELAAEFKAFYTPSMAKLGKPPKIVLEPVQLNGTKYMSSTNTINIQLKSEDDSRFDDWNASVFAIRHEFSHWLHYRKGGATDADLMSKIKAAGEADWKEIRKAISKKEGIFSSGSVRDDLTHYISGRGSMVKLSKEEEAIYVAFADSIGSISEGLEGWGHSETYYKNQNKWWPFAEAVANIYTLAKSFPEGKIKGVFPKLSAIVLAWR